MLVSGQTALLGFPADRDLAHQQRKAEGQRQRDIDEQKQSAAALSGKIRKSPNIAQSDRTARSSEYKSDRTGE